MSPIILPIALSRLGDQNDTIKLPKLHVYQITQQLSARSDSVNQVRVSTQADDGTRIVIPNKKWKAILKLIHEGHIGLNKCKLHMKEDVYWPGLNDHLEKLVLNCELCLKYSNSKCKQEAGLIFRSRSVIRSLDQTSNRHFPL